MAAEDGELSRSSKHNRGPTATSVRRNVCSGTAANTARSCPPSLALVAPVADTLIARAVSEDSSAHGSAEHRSASPAASSSGGHGCGGEGLPPLLHRRTSDLATLMATASSRGTAATAATGLSGRPIAGHPPQVFLLRATSREHGLGGGRGAGGDDGDDEQHEQTRRHECAAATMASMRTPLTRDGSLILAIEAVTAAFGGGGSGYDARRDASNDDIRQPLSREESLLRAVEVVTGRSGDVGGGGEDDPDFEKAAAELIASVGLVHMDGADGDEVFCGVVAAPEGSAGAGDGDVAMSA